MASGGPVGFTLQADVVGATLSAHALAGRALRALDGSQLDQRSVLAAVWLGKQMPVSRAHESAVYAQLQTARRGADAVVARVLSIGWGHTDFALELARTRAGAAALVLLGALAAGSTVHVAAQILSELLGLAGLGADQVPSIEVLKPVIGYLAPPMRDLGFPRVLEHIVSTAEASCMKRLRQRPPDGLSSLGDASVLAGAIRQLCLTSSLGETVYFITKQRGAWLTAFASHVLGMAVELLCGSATVFAAAGSHGKAIFQLDKTYNPVSARLSDFNIIPDPQVYQGCQPMTIDYTIGDVVAAELARYPGLDGAIHAAVAHAVISLSFAIQSRMARSPYPNAGSNIMPIRHFTISTHFKATSAMMDTLGHFGVHGVREALESHSPRRNFPIRPGRSNDAASNGLYFFTPDELASLLRACPVHREEPAHLGADTRCYCREVGRLVHGVATSAIALMHFSYNPSQLRLRADIINGSIRTPWSESCILSHGAPSANAVELLKHLGQLLDGAGQFDPTNLREFEWTPQTLGVSGGNLTIVYRAVLSQDAFDSWGRLLTIVPGSISVNGTICRRLLDNPEAGLIRSLMVFSRSSQAANGHSITPHYLPSDSEVEILADNLDWDEPGSIFVTARIRTPQAPDFPNRDNFSLLGCLHHFLRAHVPSRCFNTGHAVSDPLGVNASHGTVKLATFGKTLDWIGPQPKLVVYPLQGRKLEQIVQASLCLTIPTIQMFCCLNCAVASSYQNTQAMKEVIIALPEAEDVPPGVTAPAPVTPP